jgi:monoamine oxidase
MDRIETDVCIVGAGYAGLTAARRLHRAGGQRWSWKRAGTETATISHGTIDGAIRSGLRAAGEVVALA